MRCLIYQLPDFDLHPVDIKRELHLLERLQAIYMIQILKVSTFYESIPLIGYTRDYRLLAIELKAADDPTTLYHCLYANLWVRLYDKL